MDNNVLYFEGEDNKFMYLSMTPTGLLEIEAGVHPYTSIHHILPMEVVLGWVLGIFLRANFDPKRLAQLADIDDLRLVGFIQEIK